MVEGTFLILSFFVELLDLIYYSNNSFLYPFEKAHSGCFDPSFIL